MMGSLLQCLGDDKIIGDDDKIVHFSVCWKTRKLV